ncbi:hypothetical protein V5799_028808 [Amblyomma americanum]|uniref:Uncharacterized protein n=1 Tax=Amblyomma americanum TaxID=6943 RepID=A0AAQ4DBU1_AMBAM
MTRSLGRSGAAKNTVLSYLISSPQINRIALSSMLVLRELTREKTGSTHLSSITPASGDCRLVDQRYTKQRQDMIRALGSSGASKNTVRSCLILSPQINRIALSSMLLLHALTREKTGSTHVSSITPASGDRRQVDQRYTK